MLAIIQTREVDTLKNHFVDEEIEASTSQVAVMLTCWTGAPENTERHVIVSVVLKEVSLDAKGDFGPMAFSELRFNSDYLCPGKRSYCQCLLSAVANC